VTSDNRHSDQFRRGERGGAPAKEPAPQPAATSLDNDAQAAAADEFRTREYTVGGDDDAAAPRTAGIDRAIERIHRWVRESARPSPFGTGHFPPLPLPPGMADSNQQVGAGRK
jgi:hypothetical protein